jgi:sigma-B regulation protein RsbU (phosphoserine phosphatase)
VISPVAEGIRSDAFRVMTAMTIPISPAANANGAWPIKVLLVDDQQLVGETVRAMLGDEPDLEFRFCPDPAIAIDVANEFKPTVILQDLMMPDIDGLLLVKFFRANAATRDTPLVVLSSKEEPVIKARAFALGANDYMVKLPDRLEVLARIRYHSRGYINLLQRNEAYRALAESQKHMAAEVAQAARYVRSLLPPKATAGPVTIDWLFVPSTQLAGDMFGYHWLDDEHLAIYLLDVSGHGVGSSLLAVSAANLLSAKSLLDTDPRDPAKVIMRLNDTFQMERQDGKYFTIWYGVYHSGERKLAYCNAGHPPALLWANGSLTMLEADGPAVGMMPDLPYDTRTVDVPTDARLIVFSDGSFEIEQRDGQMWPFSAFIAHLTSIVGSPGLIDRHLAHARDLGSSEMLADDFSMLEAVFHAMPPKSDARRKRRSASTEVAN